MANGTGSSDLDSEGPAGISAAGVSVTAPQPTLTRSSDETTRQWVAFILLFLLALIVVTSFVVLTQINGSGGAATAADDAADAARLMDLMNVIFGPIVTLFSSVVGFYFGARTAREATPTIPPPPGV